MSQLSRFTQSLEDAYFVAQDQLLIEYQRFLKQQEETRDLLSRVSGISDTAVLDKLVALGVQPSTLSSLAVFPLVAVAWADGSVSASERSAVLESLKGATFAAGIDLQVVGHWLEVKPDPKLLDAWLHYAQALAAELTPGERIVLRDELLGHARHVAEATGGLLGLGTVSASEQTVLDRLASALA